MQARRPWNLVAGLGSSGWKKSPVQARLWVYKPCSLLSWLIESPTSGTEEWLARAGLFSCTVIFVFSIIFLVFRNNIHHKDHLVVLKLCLSEVGHFHPFLRLHIPKNWIWLRSADSEYLMSSPPSSFYFLRRPPTRHVLPYKHSTWHDVNTKKKDNDRSHR